jgi:hypothetical protein
MPTFTFNTSSNGALRISEGLALFASNKKAVNWGWEFSKVFSDYYDDGTFHEVRFYCKFSCYFGFLMGYAVNSKLIANIQYNINNQPTSGTFSFTGTMSGKDGFAAGIKLGAGASIGIDFYVDVPVIPTISIAVSLNFDVLGYLLSLAFGQFGSGASKGRAGGDGGLNLFGENIGKLASSGRTDAALDISLKLNLFNLIPAVAAFNEGLKKMYSGVQLGLMVKPSCLVRLRPVGLFHGQHYYHFQESSLGSTINVPGSRIINVGKVPTQLKVTHGFSFGLYAGGYFEVTLVKFISVGVEVLWDILKLLNISVGTAGDFQNTVPFRGMTASAPIQLSKPKVVFHRA